MKKTTTKTTTTTKAAKTTKTNGEATSREARAKVRARRIAAVLKLRDAGVSLRQIEVQIPDVLGLAKDDPRKGKGWVAFHYFRAGRPATRAASVKAAANNAGWKKYRASMTTEDAPKVATKKTAKKS